MVAHGTYAWLSKIRDRLPNFLPPPQTGFARSAGRIADLFAAEVMPHLKG
jgi:hypothetical protein